MMANHNTTTKEGPARARIVSQARLYPQCCTSAYCGSGPDKCPTCPCHPALLDFERWREEHAAVQTDPIWCPNVYTATK